MILYCPEAEYPPWDVTRQRRQPSFYSFDFGWSGPVITRF